MKKPHKKKKNLRALLAALCILLFALVLFSAWKIYSIMSGYKAAERRYDNLAGAVVATADPVSSAEGAPSANAAASGEDDAKGDPVERSPIEVDFSALREISGDVIGWICLPHTPINYPVVQGRDNEFYLDHFLDGNSSAGGSIFADYLCPSDFSGKNTIIYGHNMRDGSMFALVDDYAEQSFYNEHPVMYLNTPSQNYRLDIFSAFTADPEGFVYTASFASEEDYAAFLRALSASSEISCSAEADVSDRIVTLSTCAYTGEDVRFVLCAKLCEIG